jgi:hypothetical protein
VTVTVTVTVTAMDRTVKEVKRSFLRQGRVVGLRKVQSGLPTYRQKLA